MIGLGAWPMGECEKAKSFLFPPLNRNGFEPMFTGSAHGAPRERKLEMSNISITLPESHVVSSRDRNVSVDLGKLSGEIIAKLALHGLTQKVADSAASALADAGFEGLSFKDLPDTDKDKVRDAAVAAMNGTIESLIAGEWSERRAAQAVDPVTKRIRAILGEWLRATGKDAWAPFKALEGDARGEALDKFFAEQDDATQAAVKEQAETELAAEAKQKAKIAKLGLQVKIGK